MMTLNQMNVAVIPARGGSKGIPRKNIRTLHGKPLIYYTIQAALKAKTIHRVVVTTDDEEIAYVARQFGVNVRMRDASLAKDDIPLDPVIYDVISQLEQQQNKLDAIVTIQPTSPLITPQSIDKAVQQLHATPVDTVISVVNKPHLSWRKEGDAYLPNFTERKNRQYLPDYYIETGAIFASKREVHTHTNRIGKTVTLLPLNEEESIDIDSVHDWWVAEKILQKKKIVIRVNGYKYLGLGHIYRMLIIADYLIDHDLIFLLNEDDGVAQRIIREKNYTVQTFEGDEVKAIKQLAPDIVINDILDTSEEYILCLKNLGFRVVNFEDLGPGAKHADAVINALYESPVKLSNFYTGEKYYCARNEFINARKKKVREDVNRVLITFGGADPNNLTLKTLQAIAQSNKAFHITIIIGPGYRHKNSLKKQLNSVPQNVELLSDVKFMAEKMTAADLIFTSAGRTMYEIAMIGTPAIVIAQNSREMTHTFGHIYNGFYNLGLHSELSESDITHAFEKLYDDYDLRTELSERMKVHDLSKGIQRVCSIILNEKEEEVSTCS